MTTTIQIEEQTKSILDIIKAKENLANHDEVIKHLTETHIDTATMFGITAKNPLHFGKDDELQFHEL